MFIIEPLGVNVNLAPLEEWGRIVLRRSLVAAVRIWGVVLLLHIVTSGIVFEVEVGWFHLAPFLLVTALLHRQEGWAWTGAGLAVVSALASAPTVAPTALAAGTVLGWRGWREGCPRYYIGTVLAVHVALRMFGSQRGAASDAALWLLTATAAALVALARRYNMPLALLPFVSVIPWFVRHVPALGFHGWGAVLLGLGFLSLVAGVAYNWTHRLASEPDDVEDASL